MPRSPALRLGEGARCSVLLKKLHPSPTINELFPNYESQRRLDDLRATHQAEVTRRGRTYTATFFSSASAHGHILHCANRWVTVLEEGNADGYWDNPRARTQAGGGGAATNADTNGASEQGAPIDDLVFNASNRAEDIARVRDEGHEVDDDNEPAPENIPAAGSTTNNGGLKEGQSGGWNGVDRMSVETGEVKKMPSFADGWTPQGKTYLEIFLHMLPLQWFTNVLVAKTSEGLVNASNPPLSFGEMFCKS